METSKVVLDTDFFLATTKYEGNTRLLEKLMKEANYEMVMHEFVANVELNGNRHLEYLIKNGKIEIIKEKSFIEYPDEDYEEYFHMAYYKTNLVELGDEDLETYGYITPKSGENLGEIRSFYLAYCLGYQMLLSNDGHSEQIAQMYNSRLHSVDVKKLSDVLKDNYNNGSLRWKDIKATVPKVYSTKPWVREELCSMFKMK